MAFISLRRNFQLQSEIQTDFTYSICCLTENGMICKEIHSSCSGLEWSQYFCYCTLQPARYVAHMLTLRQNITQINLNLIHWTIILIPSCMSTLLCVVISIHT